MTNATVDILWRTWMIISEVAPYLLLGFGLAGMIALFLKRSFIERWLGRPGMGSIVRATLAGVPMPLCSCGVIPTAAAIRRQGASKGATAAFLVSTPQIGVDSIAATWGLLGPPMAIIRVLIAWVSGLAAGFLVQTVARDDRPAARQPADEPSKDIGSFKEAMRFAFIELPRDLALPLTVGLVLAGLLGALLPQDFFTRIGLQGWPAYVLISAIGIPLYMCSTGSIPFAFMLLQAGLSPGAVLVFLVTGPSTSIATLTTMRTYMDTRSIIAYLAAITGTAWIAAWIVDTHLDQSLILGHMHQHMMEPGLPSQIAAIALVGILLFAFYSKWKSRRSCCGTSCCEAKACENNCCH